MTIDIGPMIRQRVALAEAEARLALRCEEMIDEAVRRTTKHQTRASILRHADKWGPASIERYVVGRVAAIRAEFRRLASGPA